MHRNRHSQTLRQPATLSGRGLHGNLPCKVVLRPAERASCSLEQGFPRLPPIISMAARTLAEKR